MTPTGATTGRVVVGVDGSAGSRRAAAWGLEDARARQARLDLVVAWRMPVGAYAPPGLAPEPADDVTTEGRILDDVLSDLDTDGVEVSRRVSLGSATDVLRGIADDPDVDVVVVGTRGRSAATGVVLGSVSRDLSRHCPAPLVIVPDHARPAGSLRGRVVVGVDGTPGGDAAFAWALEEARIRHATLEVVAAWSTVQSSLPPGTPRGTSYREAVSRAATDLVDRLVTGLPEPRRTVVRTVVEGPAADVLLDRSADSDLLVLGTRGRAHEILQGSVRHACLRGAAVPVAIVR